MRQSSIHSLSIVAALSYTACAGDDVQDSTATDTTGAQTSAGGSEGSGASGTTTDATDSTQATSGTDTSTSDATSTEGTTDTTATTDTGAPPGVLAGDIMVDNVELNQGVSIRIASAGQLLPIDGFEAPLIGGRTALVRASYALGDSFSPRPIIGRLWLHDSLQETDTLYDDERMIAGPGDWQSFGGTFQWIVDADELRENSELRIQLLEVAEEGEAVGDISGSQLPARGFAPLAVWADPMVLDVVLVPFTCAGEEDLDLSPQNLADFEAYLFNTFPIQALNLTVRDPVASAGCSEFDAAEVDLPALRIADGAAPWVYYGGLLPGAGGGYSISISGGDSMDYRRTFASHTWRDAGLTFDLYAHELGHNHGRDHSFEDPDFPGSTVDNCGTIAGYGWGPRSALMPSSGWSNDLDLGLAWFDPHETLLQPTGDPCAGAPEGNRWNFNDFMSYQYPYWVSAYTYAAAAERVRLISSWSADAGAPAPASSETLRLIFSPEGELRRVRYPHSGPSQLSRAAERPSARGRALDLDLGGGANTALCTSTTGPARLPVRRRPGLLERPDADGRMRSSIFDAYEVTIGPDVDPASCTLEIDGRSLPFVTDEERPATMIDPNRLRSSGPRM